MKDALMQFALSLRKVAGKLPDTNWTCLGPIAGLLEETVIRAYLQGKL